MIAALALLLPLLEERPLARIELEPPRHTPFVLRATLPVPPQPAQDFSHWVIEAPDANRTRTPAQVEVITRAPDGTPQVVEVIARVAKVEGGDTISYTLHRSEHPEPASFQATAKVAQLLDEQGPGLELRAEDVFGQRYTAELSGLSSHPGLGKREWLRQGAWLRQRKVAAVMVPLPNDAQRPDPLPHLMGVHAYLTERSGEDCVSLDLRIHNGLCSGSQSSHPLEAPVGALYWKSLELVVPKDWEAISQVRDPFLGAAYEEQGRRVIPLVKALPDGKLHFQPPQFQFQRRLALVPQGQTELARNTLANDGLGYAAPGPGLWSWSNPDLGFYFPQRAALAQADFFRRGTLRARAGIRALETARMRSYARALETGEPHGWYTVAKVMGWAHPWFVAPEGGPGGEAISTLEGYYAVASASRDAYTHFQLLHRMNASRHSDATWNRRGEAVGYHDWLDHEGKIPFDFRTHGLVRIPVFTLPNQWGAPLTAQARAVHERGLRPAYDQGNWDEMYGQVKSANDSLLYWWPHDDQHLVRWTKNAKALVWLGNDALAKDDLRLSAELFRLMYHESPHTLASWSKGITLRVHQELVRAHPHQGIGLGREHAWGIDAACAAYSLADDAWRARMRPWFEKVSQLMLDAEMPNGLVMRFLNRILCPDLHLTMQQSFESLFLTHAMRCMNESVFRGMDDTRRAALEGLILRGLETLYFGPCFSRIPNNWQPDPANPTIFVQGPRQGMAISLNDDYATPPFCDVARWGPNYLPEGGLVGNVEYFHCAWALLYAARIAPGERERGLDSRYLRRILDCGQPLPSFEALMAEYQQQTESDSYDNSANWVEFAGYLQRAGVSAKSSRR